MGLRYRRRWRGRRLPLLGPDPGGPVASNHSPHHAGCAAGHVAQVRKRPNEPLRPVSVRINPSRLTSFTSYFLLLVPPAGFPQWSSAVTGGVCVCSEERQQLLDGSVEEEESQQSTSGRCCSSPAANLEMKVLPLTAIQTEQPAAS